MTKTPHKYCQLIKAWADGAEIEKQANTGEWFIDYKPDWYEDSYYRIFYEHKPDVVRYGIAQQYWGNAVAEAGDNIKLTFDGKTGKLKSAEVIS